MASEALGQLIEGMRANGPDFTRPPAEARAEFEGLLATMPEPEGFTFHDTDLGGIPAIECHADGGAGEGALLYFHGGGYVVGSARGYRGLPANLGRAAGLPAFAIEYRLAPEHPFPAAIEDAVTAYRALLERGVDAGRIVLAGDSAGGGLAVAAMLALREQGLPLPAAALLLSPWADLACEGRSFVSKVEEDPSLTPAGLRAMAGHYLQGADPRDPLASPIFADLSGLPPLMIQVGSSEILLDDAVRLAGAAGAGGTAVRLEIWPEMIHVWQSFAFMLPEGREAIEAAGRFLRDCL